MPNISIISKTSHEVLQTLDSSQVKEINLTENSVVVIDIPKEDVAKFAREGNSAIIVLKTGEIIVIQNYFNNDNTVDNNIVFDDDSGQLFWAEFTDSNGVITDTIKYHLIDDVDPLLYHDNDMVAMLLPWVGGGATLGALGAAIGDDNKDDGDNTPPSKPVIHPINPKSPITGEGEPGGTVIVKFPDGTTATAIVDSKGNWTVPNPGNLKDGDEVTAVVKDPSGNTSPEDTETVDGIPPAIDINPINQKDPIIGVTESGGKVTVNFPDGTTVTAVADSKGNWSVPNPGNLKDGEEVTATAKDPAGNEGIAKEEVDGKAPIIDIDPIKPGSPITGETEPGAEVIVKLPDGTTVTTVADSKGHWEVPPNPDLKDGDVVEVIAKDPAGNEGTAQEEVDGKAPIIDIDPIKPGGPITGETEPGAEVIVKFPDGTTDRKSTRLNSSHRIQSRMPSSA